jgi:hypothetical protein
MSEKPLSFAVKFTFIAIIAATTTIAKIPPNILCFAFIILFIKLTKLQIILISFSGQTHLNLL